MKNYIVWYWRGGREVGSWHRASPTYTDFHPCIKRLESAGYVAHPGTLSIGPPEGPPSDAEFKRLGL